MFDFILTEKYWNVCLFVCVFVSSLTHTKGSNENYRVYFSWSGWLWPKHISNSSFQLVSFFSIVFHCIVLSTGLQIKLNFHIFLCSLSLSSILSGRNIQDMKLRKNHNSLLKKVWFDNVKRFILGFFYIRLSNGIWARNTYAKYRILSKQFKYFLGKTWRYFLNKKDQGVIFK